MANDIAGQIYQDQTRGEQNKALKDRFTPKHGMPATPDGSGKKSTQTQQWHAKQTEEPSSEDKILAQIKIEVIDPNYGDMPPFKVGAPQNVPTPAAEPSTSNGYPVISANDIE